MLFPAIINANLTLKNIFPDEVSSEYIGWLRDPIVNRFMEFRHQEISLARQKFFIDSINASEDSSIFGIFLDHVLFVGTIKIGPINSKHATADLGIFIGNVEHHGKGIGTNAIGSLCARFAEMSVIRKVNAGVISKNFGSLRAFEKNGFVQEGLRRQQYEGPNGTTEDEVLLGKIL